MDGGGGGERNWKSMRIKDVGYEYATFIVDVGREGIRSHTPHHHPLLSTSLIYLLIRKNAIHLFTPLLRADQERHRNPFDLSTHILFCAAIVLVPKEKRKALEKYRGNKTRRQRNTPQRHFIISSFHRPTQWPDCAGHCINIKYQWEHIL